MTKPLREDLEHTAPEPELPGVITSAPHSPASPTLTRRALIGAWARPRPAWP